MSDFVVAFICITVGALCSVAGFLMGFNSKMTPREKGGYTSAPPSCTSDSPGYGPPMRNPPPPVWPQGRIAQLEEKVARLKGLLAALENKTRGQVDVAGLTEVYAFHVFRRIPGFSGPTPYETICYTLDKDTAAQLLTGTEYRAELRLVWQLPDGRLARRDGERTTLHLIRSELVK